MDRQIDLRYNLDYDDALSNAVEGLKLTEEQIEELRQEIPKSLVVSIAFDDSDISGTYDEYDQDMG